MKLKHSAKCFNKSVSGLSSTALINKAGLSMLGFQKKPQQAMSPLYEIFTVIKYIF
jgi:hypothetical protein